MRSTAVLAAQTLALCLFLTSAAPTSAGRVPPAQRRASIAPYQGFVENKGQWAEDVLFFAREGRIEATVFRSGFALRPAAELPSPEALQRGEAPRPQPPALFLRFEHCGSIAEAERVEGLQAGPTRHHFLRGARSASAALGFARLRFREVAPGIDVELRRAQGHFEYDLIAAPGAELESFSIAIEGADAMTSCAPDRIELHTAAGLVEQRMGACWQLEDGGDGTAEARASGADTPGAAARSALSAEFARLSASGTSQRFGFRAPGWSRSAPLVIDPSLVFASYIGGGGQELLESLAVDAAGASYPACWGGAGTPTTPGSAQGAPGGGVDAWVGKLSPDGSTLEWGTYLGGALSEADVRVAVDTDGTVVLVGSTWSADFPTTAGSYQPAFAGVDTKSDLFITRLAAHGGGIVWSTFFGGPDYDIAGAMALFPNGDVAIGVTPGDSVTPYTEGPTATPGAFDPICDYRDKMLIRLSADGATRIFQTYFKTTRILDMAIDPAGDICFCGSISASDVPLPTTPGVVKPNFPASLKGEAYVAKLGGLGTQLKWATYLGGDSHIDTAWGIAVDVTGSVYVCGHTFANDFPVTAGAYDTTLGGATDGWAAKLLPAATGLVWSTYIGSPNAQDGSGFAEDIAVDAAGNVSIVGAPNASGWPTTQDAFQPFFIGPAPHGDCAYTKFDALGSMLVYSTMLGGSGTDYFPKLGIEPGGDPRIACLSFAADFPTTAAAFDPTYNGVGDIVVAAFDLPLLPWRLLGGGLAGAKDTPNLVGTGALTPGTPTRFVLKGAAPSSFGWFVVGASQLWLPLLGGTLVPSPDLYLAKTTNAAGAIDFALPWPPLPAGTELTFQAWIFDAGAPMQWSASNALLAIAQP